MASKDIMSVPSEIISVNVGQAGIQMGNGMWELLCLEHGVSPDGHFIPSVESKRNASNCDLEKFDVFFYHTCSNQVVPRAVIVDLEPTVVDEIRNGAYRDLFHPTSLVNGLEDAANNYARGNFTVGKAMLNRLLEEVRKQANRCDSLQGFHFINGMGGGTGSGFCALLLEKIGIEYGKSTKIMMNIFPGPTMSTAMVEPYNTALGMHSTIDHSDLNITLDNEALYNIAINHLDIQRPTYNDINRLMAQIVSSITCSLRFPCSINCDMNQLQTNLVPFPRIHFPICCYAPIVSNRVVFHETLDIKQIIKDLFEEQTRLVSINVNEGRYMSCNVIFRGNVSPKDVNVGVSEIKRNSDIEFVDWCPTSFKIGICSQPPLSVPASGLAKMDRCCSLLANNTSIGEKWNSIMTKFDTLYSKRAFIHWYVGEGMEEGEMTEARLDIVNLVNDYINAGKSSCEIAESECGGVSPKREQQEAFEQPDEFSPSVAQTEEEDELEVMEGAEAWDEIASSSDVNYNEEQENEQNDQNEDNEENEESCRSEEVDEEANTEIE